MNSGPWRHSSRSVPQMPLHATATRTWPGPGGGGTGDLIQSDVIPGMPADRTHHLVIRPSLRGAACRCQRDGRATPGTPGHAARA